MEVIDDIHILFGAECIETKRIIIELVLKTIQQISQKPIGSLQDCHNYISKLDINNLRYRAFQSINSPNIDWVKYVFKLAGAHIAQVIGPDYLIQSKINLSIQMPGDETSILDMHSDCKSGDSPWQMNLWIPLTEAYSTNSMFLVSKEDSLCYFKQLRLTASESTDVRDKMRRLSHMQQDFSKIFINAGQDDILLFNPGVLHGNELNTTNKTRVSLNIRIKSIFAPCVKPENSDRGIGPYYRKGNITKNTEFCEKVSHLFG
jgi:sporadic carbohydrate cluster 2OG-Fe(II) oxygenase